MFLVPFFLLSTTTFSFSPNTIFKMPNKTHEGIPEREKMRYGECYCRAKSYLGFCQTFPDVTVKTCVMRTVKLGLSEFWQLFGRD